MDRQELVLELVLELELELGVRVLPAQVGSQRLSLHRPIFLTLRSQLLLLQLRQPRLCSAVPSSLWCFSSIAKAGATLPLHRLLLRQQRDSGSRQLQHAQARRSPGQHLQQTHVQSRKRPLHWRLRNIGTRCRR